MKWRLSCPFQSYVNFKQTAAAKFIILHCDIYLPMFNIENIDINTRGNFCIANILKIGVYVTLFSSTSISRLAQVSAVKESADSFGTYWSLYLRSISN